MINIFLFLFSLAQNLPINYIYLPSSLNNLPQSRYISQKVNFPYIKQSPLPQNIIQNVQIYSPSFLNEQVKRQGVLLPILPSKTKIGYLNSNIIFLADQLLRNMDVDQKEYPVIVTTFVNLNNFKETSDLGRLLKENLVHELQIRGWKVIDINYMPKIKINKNGEFVLTRDMKNLVKKYKVASILVGTYAIADNAVIVNARIINAKNGIILSTGQFEIPLSYVASLLKNTALRPVEIIVTGE